MPLLSFSTPLDVYEALVPVYQTFPLLSIPSLFINAPFGRFAKPDSKFALDGRYAWIFMELPSPLIFALSLLSPPLTSSTSLLFPSLARLSHLPATSKLLAGLYLTHYINRAIISPLRTPCRSPSHLLVVACAVAFNLLNGLLMGAWIGGRVPGAQTAEWGSARFWVGVGIWAVGFMGNWWHDEVLLRLRRGTGKQKGEKNRYEIPHGGLYRFISYPNYFCEWIEWLGYALAATRHFDARAPPWLFWLALLGTMSPRAVRGHMWYRTKFGEEYPRERRAVVPWLL